MQMLTNEPMGGITSGLEDNDSVQALSNVTSGIETLFQNIDEADNPKEIMDAIRGDEASVEQRRTELAQLVGEQDAKQTPESVLTIVQPIMTVIESTGGIADLDTETPVAPNIDESQQMEAMARMQSGESPVMLSRGNPPTVDINALQQTTSSPLGVLALAKRLAPETPTLESFERQYVDKPSAYEQYASVLPFQQLAQFGQIVGRSPTLLDAVLSPETIKLADPVLKLNMLQAKEKADREAKATKGFIEAKRDAEKSKSDLFGKILPKFLDQKSSLFEDGTIYTVDPQGKPSLFREGQDKTVIIGDTLLRLDPTTKKFVPEYVKPGANIKLYDTPKGQFAIDYSKPKKGGGFAVSALPGGKTDAEVSAEFFKFIDDGSGGGFAIDKRNPTTIDEETGLTVLNPIFNVQGRDKTSVQSTQAGLMVVNETDPDKSFLIPDTAKKEFIKVGSKETGFALVNKFSGETKAIQGLKEWQPEYFEQLDRFAKASVIVNNPSDYNPGVVEKAKLEVSALSNKLLPASTEFEKLRDDNAKLFRKTLMEEAGIDGDSADIDRQVQEFIFNLNNDRITKLTTNASTYDTQKSLKDTYSKMLGKLQEDTNDRASKSESLEKLGKLQKLVSESTRTGATAPFRLAVGKLLEDLGIKDSVIGKLGIDAKAYEDFIGGKLANLELASKIGSQFAVEFASSFPGNLNQSEVELIQNAGINLTTTKDGIAVMEQIFKGAADRDRQEQKIINDYMSNDVNNTKTPMKQYAEINARLIKNREQNPLITPQIKDKIQGFTEEREFMLQVGGGDSTQSFMLTPDRRKKYDIVKATGANTFEEFLARSSPMQEYAKEISGNPDASFSTNQLKQIFNLYQPLTLVRNPNFKAN